jgi:hypothetical protein
MIDPKEHQPSDLCLPECPPSGEGCHRWLYLVINGLVNAGLDDDDIEAWVDHWMSRPAQPGEVENTLRKIRGGGLHNRTHYIPRHDLDPDAIKEATKEGPTSFEEIEAMSPIDPRSVTVHDYLRMVYADGERTVVFNDERSQGQMVWGHSTPRGFLDWVIRNNRVGAWFLMNPVSGEKTFIERLGKASRRAEESISAYKFALVESDKIEPNLWLTILKKLPLPIVSVTLSGNESAHSIILVNATSKEQWSERVRKLASLVVPLGACQGSLTAVRLTRLPFVERKDTGKEQRLLYLNPTPSPLPLTMQSAS